MVELATVRAFARLCLSGKHSTLLCARVISTNQASTMAYFSVTRAMLGRSEEELQRDHGIPDIPPINVYHARRDIKCSPSKMNLVARQVRNLSITEALKQMEFSPKLAAVTLKEVLEEAQKMAVKDYGVDSKEDLFVKQAYVTKGQITKGIRYHARGRHGILHHRHCNLFVILEEGDPLPKPTRRKSWKVPELTKIKRHPVTIVNSLSWW